jgi:hypothetical protein
VAVLLLLGLQEQGDKGDLFVYVARGGEHLKRELRRRQFGVCLSDFTPPINFTSFLPIALHTSQHFGLWTASKQVMEYRPPAPSDDNEKTDGLHKC